MTRTIPVSTDVFAAIWAQRQDGEESEDRILRRILGCAIPQADAAPSPGPQESGGYHDRRNDVHFPQGFEIFRTYKRKDYRAVAQDGRWLRLDTEEFYQTLNQLNASIAAGSENVWNGNWKFKDADGTIRSIDALRH
ncbi:hypothetical protein [uncultured Ruegeria sp.]|uniref:hypothetical protein n=1 Tax=uncultured Ruegeria sp. TaxID=259304 RepID=UPI002625D191|nr:hypothetical protein [uncultured Ruegeria sp.]